VCPSLLNTFIWYLANLLITEWNVIKILHIIQKTKQNKNFVTPPKKIDRVKTRNNSQTTLKDLGTFHCAVQRNGRKTLAVATTYFTTKKKKRTVIAPLCDDRNSWRNVKDGGKSKEYIRRNFCSQTFMGAECEGGACSGM
jgi:hypothetical protein